VLAVDITACALAPASTLPNQQNQSASRTTKRPLSRGKLRGRCCCYFYSSRDGGREPCLRLRRGVEGGLGDGDEGLCLSDDIDAERIHAIAVGTRRER
jgi:hypothetical protein